MQREMMDFYRENKINPFASCVPLLLQLPGVPRALLPAAKRRVQGRDRQRRPELPRHPDLDEKATGAALVILIVLYFVTMVGSTSIMASSAEGNQRLMMYALPVFFTPFIISFPAGLIVYWITTNLWTMGQQWVVKQVIPPPPKPTEDEERGGEAPTAAAAQEETPALTASRRRGGSGRLPSTPARASVRRGRTHLISTAPSPAPPQ